MVSLPLDDNGKTINLAPSKAAIARTLTSSISSSTQVTLNSESRFLQVYAIDKDVFMKWGTTAVTTANFDELILAGQRYDFDVARESNGTLHTALTFIERAATATLVVIQK
ncbi:MAG: hypothetical protein M3Q81_04460 [bacterium]|nr:hypothetical protein [bacterium]